jgi:hypothetical protein
MKNRDYDRDQLNMFFKAYVEAALWSSFEKERPKKRLRDLPSDVRVKLLSDCEKFLDRAAPIINENYHDEAYPDAGIAFWFTRNFDEQHGPTFDSEGWPDQLTTIAESLGEQTIFELKDGRIVVE